jgi:tRNA threonylcarbamoyladenosine modification (KEOPS) complex Cgi121 subunit
MSNHEVTVTSVQATAIETADQIIRREVDKALVQFAAGEITSKRFDEIIIALSDVSRLSRP